MRKKILLPLVAIFMSSAAMGQNVGPIPYAPFITVTGAIKSNGSNVFTQAACADLSNGATGCSTATGTSGATLPLLNSSPTASGNWTWQPASGTSMQSIIAGDAVNGSKAILYLGNSANLQRSAIWFDNTSDSLNLFAGAVGTAGTQYIILRGNGSLAFPRTTTGTNADFACLDASLNLLLQATACTISSIRFKELVRPFTASALDDISKFSVWTYRMKATKPANSDPNSRTLQIGLTAENVASVDKRCSIYESDMKTPKSYRQECVIALLVKGVQEQQGIITDMRRRITTLEHKK